MGSKKKKQALLLGLLRFFIYCVQLCVWLALVAALAYELRTSLVQSQLLSLLA